MSENGSAQGMTLEERFATLEAVLAKKNAQLSRAMEIIAEAGRTQTGLREQLDAARAEAAQSARSLSLIADMLHAHMVAGDPTPWELFQDIIAPQERTDETPHG